MIKSIRNSRQDISQITTYQSGVAQSSAYRIVQRVVSEFLVDYNLTAMQWFAIGHIYDAGTAGLTLTELKYVLGTTLPYITNTVKLLESMQIVVKKTHSTDSRTKIVSIDPSYSHTVEKIERELRERLRFELYKNNRITRDELQAYIHVLYKLVEADQPS